MDVKNVKVIELPVFGIKIKLGPNGSGTITSDLSNTGDPRDELDGIESLVLAHACAGVPVQNPAYVAGIEVAVNAALSHTNSDPASDPKTSAKMGDWALLRFKLEEIIKPADLDEWMGKPNPAFGGKTPTQLLQDGEADKLWDMAYRLESGEPS